ncbi:hypothetical protein CDD83_2273 [Cordyceps sp. RAO-2017]|nr:hypothetical protein CDD83_2273 [Cordyceps sp. RAO-2017]
MIVDYAGFPALSMAKPDRVCLRTANGADLVQYIENKKSDTQATIWKRDSTKEIILGIPGTHSLQDWATDISAVPVAYFDPDIECRGECRVHYGFLKAWNSIKSDVKKGLGSALKKHPGYGVTITGHSLGGALATLAFVSLARSQFGVRHAFTYGQPRVGNKDFAYFVDRLAKASEKSPGNFFRVTHANGRSHETGYTRKAITDFGIASMLQMAFRGCPRYSSTTCTVVLSTGSRLKFPPRKQRSAVLSMNLSAVIF